MSGPVQLLAARLGPGVHGCFTTRYGGVSAGPYAELNLSHDVRDEERRSTANRDLLARAIRVAPERVCFVRQVHGAQVLTVAREDVGDHRLTAGEAAADAMVTAAGDAPLAVLVADCVPVLLADPVARVVGAAHAGRRGLLAGVVQAALAAMADLGAAPTRVRASVGPSICGRCYEVPEGMADHVGAAVPGTRATTGAGTAGLDLAAGAVTVLRAAGVAGIERVGACTYEDERFYSFRRDGGTGRSAGVVWLDGA